MGFWFFMLLNNLLVPVLMIGFGTQFRRKPPKEINDIYGYRTKMSRLNKNTWEYAHLYFGNLWLRMGLGMLPLTVVCMLPFIGKDENVVGIAGAVIMTVQVLLLLLPIVWTERELHRRFDAQGRRK